MFSKRKTLSSSSEFSEDEEFESKNDSLSESSSSDDGDDGEWNAKPKPKSKSKTKKKTNKDAKKKVKTFSNNTDKSDKSVCEKEEGEVDASDDDEEFNDGFDENLVGDEEDQKRLDSMTEKERELELFNRNEKRQVLLERFKIRRRLKLERQERKNESKSKEKDRSEKASRKKTKREKNLDSDFDYTDSASRSIERRRNMEDKRKVKDAMKGLKAEREKKKMKKLYATDIYTDSSDSEPVEIKSSKKHIKKYSTSDDVSSFSSMSEDSEAYKEKNFHKSENEVDAHAENENFIFTMEHLNSMRISRWKMENWCHAPFFKETVINAFVRIGVGNIKVPQYIVGQIVDVVETPRVYSLGKTKTNKGIKLKNCNSTEKTYRLEYVSNSEFTIKEYEDWYSKMLNGNCKFPTKELVEGKIKDIQKAVNYNYSEADIMAMVAEKERFKDKPTNFAVKKTQLLKDKEYAEMNGDHEKAADIAREIDLLEEESKKLEKLRTQSIASISFINERNRLRNLKEAERAIAESSKDGQNNPDDPFTRRKCTPTMIHVFNKNKQAQNENSEQDNSNKNREKIKVQPKVKENNELKFNSTFSRNQNNKATKPESVNDMFSVHNFDIKIDFGGLDPNVSNQNATIIIPNNKTNGNTKESAGQPTNSTTHRRSLNLDEYKKKKGLI